MKDSTFEVTLNPAERTACNYFKMVTDNFLGNVGTENYCDIANEILDNFKENGLQYVLIDIFLYSHFRYFPIQFRCCQ
jgi:hypothetical protein